MTTKEDIIDIIKKDILEAIESDFFLDHIVRQDNQIIGRSMEKDAYIIVLELPAMRWRRKVRNDN